MEILCNVLSKTLLSMLSKKDSKDQESINQVPHLSQDTKWESTKSQ